MVAALVLGPRGRGRPLSDLERRAVHHFLDRRRNPGGPRGLTRGAMAEAMGEFVISRKTVVDIWGRANETEDAIGVPNVNIRRVGRCGRPTTLNPEDFRASFLELELNKRKSVTHIVKRLGYPWKYSTVRRLLKKLKAVRKILRSKPLLTRQHMRDRLLFCLDHRDLATGEYQSMEDVVHIDEKWFFMRESNAKAYFLPEEDVPYTNAPSTASGPKVMFLCAVARPRHDDTGVHFDGKLGIWPIGEFKIFERGAKRGQVHWENRTMNREVFIDMLIDYVIPAIKSKFPADHEGPIFIQMDNAKPHLKVPTFDRWNEAVAASGLDIRIQYQPACSPDLNILDLGFFRALYCLYRNTLYSSVTELVEGVETEFERLVWQKLDNNFITLQTNMNEITKMRGGNHYKTVHMDKHRLRAEGTLPRTIPYENPAPVPRPDAAVNADEDETEWDGNLAGAPPDDGNRADANDGDGSDDDESQGDDFHDNVSDVSDNDASDDSDDSDDSDESDSEED